MVLYYFAELGKNTSAGQIALLWWEQPINTYLAPMNQYTTNQYLFSFQSDLNLLDNIDADGDWLNSIGDDILPSEDILSSFLDLPEGKTQS